MMDVENPFSFFTEDKKAYLEVVIPGHPAQQTWTIRWDKSLRHDSKAINREERANVVRYYQDRGFLAGYDSQTIKDMRIGNRGWVIAHSWNMPTANPTYIRIFERSAYWELVERLWRPLFFTLTDNMDRYSYIEYTVPVFPRVVTKSFVDKWYHANQNEAAYFDRIQKKSDQTRVVAQTEGDKIVLKIKDHPFVSQPVERILLYPTFPKNFPKRLSKEDQEFFRLKLLRRDAFRLKGLSNSERTRLAHLQSVGNRDTYRIHWKKWLSFNGDMAPQNALLVSQDTEIQYHTLVQKPFDLYWEQNWKRLSQTGQKIYVDIPVPMNEYRPTPILPVRTKHQDRHRLNHLARQELEAYHQREY